MVVIVFGCYLEGMVFCTHQALIIDLDIWYSNVCQLPREAFLIWLQILSSVDFTIQYLAIMSVQQIVLRRESMWIKDKGERERDCRFKDKVEREGKKKPVGSSSQEPCLRKELWKAITLSLLGEWWYFYTCVVEPSRRGSPGHLWSTGEATASTRIWYKEFYQDVDTKYIRGFYLDTVS